MAGAQRGPKRSYRCNVELLIYFRERRGWTQKQLAAASGYSERLINKAEAGQRVSAATVDGLARALSSDDEPLSFEDLITDPVALAKRYILAEYNEQANIMSAIRHFLADDVVFVLHGDPNVIPFAGEHRGIAGVERVFDIFFSLLEAPKNHDPLSCYHFLAQGNDVVVWGDSWLHPIGKPMDRPMKLVQRMKFRKGKLQSLEVVFDTEYGNQVLNPN